MVKSRKKTTRSSATTSQPPEAGGLKEQLKQLSIDQLADIVEQFLARLEKKQQREFKKLLPPVRFQDPESYIPYDKRDQLILERRGLDTVA